MAQSTEDIFQRNQSRIFQIKLIELGSGSKSSLGSGFVVGDGFTVATNYHVVSTAVFHPDKYRIEFERDDGSTGNLSLFDIDIVNDLALLKSYEDLGLPLAIREAEPNKGAEIFALGNPLDLGMTVVSGTYNGLADHNYYDRIHFSGSINSGMSGGPVLDSESRIVGINVATAGNQVSFLVPAEKLAALLSIRGEQKEDLLVRSEAQLIASQKNLMTALFDQPWPKEIVGEVEVIGEIDRIVSCWGSSSLDDEDDDNPIFSVSRGCSLQDSIYISRYMSTGSIEYEFFWYESETLAERRFYQYLENHIGGGPGNRAGKKEVSSFKCKEAFTYASEEEKDKGLVKSFYCARRYKKFQSLYDVFFLRFEKRPGKAFVSHFTLAGVTQKSSNTFFQTFLEHIKWP